MHFTKITLILWILQIHSKFEIVSCKILVLATCAAKNVIAFYTSLILIAANAAQSGPVLTFHTFSMGSFHAIIGFLNRFLSDGQNLFQGCANLDLSLAWGICRSNRYSNSD